MTGQGLTSAEIPSLLQAAQCALPMMFAGRECPDAPGMMGTCTALRFRDEYVFVTAAHVVEPNDSDTAVYVALGFSASGARSQITEVRKPRAADPNAPVDFAVMRPRNRPAFVEGESSALVVPPFARMDGVRQRATFAVAGYPLDAPDRNVVDYDASTFLFGKQVAIGSYEAPSPIRGLHTLNLSTAQTWGPNGFSGGPAFRLRYDAISGVWTPAFAGIVANGGPTRIHFIDAAYVLAFLSECVR